MIQFSIGCFCGIYLATHYDFTHIFKHMNSILIQYIPPKLNN